MLRPDVVVLKRTPQAGRRAALPASSLFVGKPAKKPTPAEAAEAAAAAERARGQKELDALEAKLREAEAAAAAAARDAGYEAGLRRQAAGPPRRHQLGTGIGMDHLMIQRPAAVAGRRASAAGGVPPPPPLPLSDAAARRPSEGGSSGGGGSFRLQKPRGLASLSALPQPPSPTSSASSSRSLRADGQGLRRNLSFGSTGQRGSAPRRSGGSPPPPPGEPPRRSPSFERSPSSRRAADPCSPTAAADAPSRSAGKLMRFEASGRRRKTQAVGPLGEPVDATL